MDKRQVVDEAAEKAGEGARDRGWAGEGVPTTANAAEQRGSGGGHRGPKEAEHSGPPPEKDIGRPLKVTQLAAEMIRESWPTTATTEIRLRVKVIGGGCAGLVYNLGFVDAPPEKHDVILESNRVPLVVDQMSLMYLRGTVIDYVDTPQGAGFRFNNPNLGRMCNGCAAPRTGE